MFDENKRRECLNCTVGDVVAYLLTKDPAMEFNINGDNLFYIHEEKDGSNISFDDNSLSEEYDNDNPKSLEKVLPKDIIRLQKFTKLYGYRNIKGGRYNG